MLTAVMRTPTRKGMSLAALILAVAMLVGVNVGIANAHNWWAYHWDKSGSRIQIQSLIFGSTQSQAEAARVDAWNKVSNLYNYRVDYHTDVSVFDGNYGDTGWAGLASIESANWCWSALGYCHITHGHARVNLYYPSSSWYRQGIYCQEVFHTYGFDHDSSGGCMGLGYYSGQSNVLTSHNASDFYNRHINH